MVSTRHIFITIAAALLLTTVIPLTAATSADMEKMPVEDHLAWNISAISGSTTDAGDNDDNGEAPPLNSFIVCCLVLIAVIAIAVALIVYLVRNSKGPTRYYMPPPQSYGQPPVQHGPPQPYQQPSQPPYHQPPRPPYQQPARPPYQQQYSSPPARPAPARAPIQRPGAYDEEGEFSDDYEQEDRVESEE